jgi:hypothetical protein
MATGFKGLKRFRKHLQQNLDAKLHEVTQDAFALLIRNSPVLLANFRGNWYGSTGAPFVGKADNFSSSDESGTIQSQRHTNPGVSKGMAPTAFEKSNLSPALKAKFGKVVFITNNLSYATALENGHSDQAPGGVLHVSAQQMRARMA